MDEDSDADEDPVVEGLDPDIHPALCRSTHKEKDNHSSIISQPLACNRTLGLGARRVSS